MNGSQSSDDLGIVKYEWQRDGTSLAIGSIVGNTDHEPVLIVSFFRNFVNENSLRFNHILDVNFKEVLGHHSHLSFVIKAIQTNFDNFRSQILSLVDMYSS